MQMMKEKLMEPQKKRSTEKGNVKWMVLQRMSGYAFWLFYVLDSCVWGDAIEQECMRQAYLRTCLMHSCVATIDDTL